MWILLRLRYVRDCLTREEWRLTIWNALCTVLLFVGQTRPGEFEFLFLLTLDFALYLSVTLVFLN
jgi:hypothetical protein